MCRALINFISTAKKKATTIKLNCNKINILARIELGSGIQSGKRLSTYIGVVPSTVIYTKQFHFEFPFRSAARVALINLKISQNL